MHAIEQELKQEIQKRMRQYEKQYQIRVLYWSFRSSINIGIKRRNSDLDIMFAYLASEPEHCLGIHDIMGHGLDFWGVDIRDILTTIDRNNRLAYESPDLAYLWHISPQHRRAGCSYYFGIYSTLGNPFYGEYHDFLSRTKTDFLDMFEKKIAARQMLETVGATVDKIWCFGRVCLYDYLFAIWRLALCRHILDGGLPGRNHIEYLLHRYYPEELTKQVEKYLDIYQKTYSKESACFPIDLFNHFLTDEYKTIQKRVTEIPYEKEDVYTNAYEKIRKMIDEFHEIYTGRKR